MRITRQVMFMDMARAASRRSTCFRLNVGALVVHNNNIVSIGWNGHEPGAPHCAGNDCPGVTPGHCGTRHAEVNALRKAEELLPAGSLVDLYVTHSPCGDCWYHLMTSPLLVETVFFETPYRNTSHLNTGREELAWWARVYEVTPAGYVIEYFTREVVELP